MTNVEEECSKQSPKKTDEQTKSSARQKKENQCGQVTKIHVTMDITSTFYLCFLFGGNTD